MQQVLPTTISSLYSTCSAKLGQADQKTILTTKHNMVNESTQVYFSLKNSPIRAE
jgi:hypothetical protein